MFGDLLMSSGQTCSTTLEILDIFGDGSCYATYPLDGDSSDLGGTYNGVDTSMAYTQGLLYDAAEFNQTLAQRITLPFTYANDVPYSISGFFAAGVNNVSGSALGEGNAVFSIGNGTTTNTAMLVTVNSTSVLFSMYGANTGNQIRVTATIALEDTEYHHIAVTYDGSKLASGMQIFIDGKLLPVTELNASYTGVNTSSPNFVIGSVFWTDSSYYRTMNGPVDHVRYFNRVLTAAEVGMLALEGPYSCDPTPQDYIAYYPLTGTAEDKTGNYNGTENGGLLYIDDITKGSVASFDGIDDSISTTLPLQTSSSQFSISLWFKSTTGIVFGSSTINGSDYLLISDSSVIYGVSTGSDTIAISPIIGAWNNVTVLFKGSANGFEVFLNNIPVGSVASTSFTGSTLQYYLGVRNTDTGLLNYFTGNVGSFRMYNRLLSVQEINTIYNYEKVTHPVPVDNGLIAYYPLASNSWDNYFNQYDGTDFGGITYDGVSAAYDGANDYTDITIPDLVSGSVTFSIWINISATNNSNSGVITQGSGTDNYVGRGLWITGLNEVLMVSRNSNSTWQQTVSVALGTGTWRHIAGKQDGNVLYLYVDGQVQATFDMGSSYNYTTNVRLAVPANIEMLYAISDYALVGNLAKARAYPIALSDAHIEEIYNSERRDFGI